MMAKVEIKKVCVFMGGFGPECRKLIDTFFDEMWEAATKAMVSGRGALYLETSTLKSSVGPRSNLQGDQTVHVFQPARSDDIHD